MVVMGIAAKFGTLGGSFLGVSTLAASIVPPSLTLPAMAPVLNVGVLTNAASFISPALTSALGSLGTHIGTQAPWLAAAGKPIVAALAVGGPLMTAGLIIGAAIALPMLFGAIGKMMDDSVDNAKANAAQMQQRVQSQGRSVMGKGQTPEVELQQTMRQPGPGKAPSQTHSPGQEVVQPASDYDTPAHPANRKDPNHSFVAEQHRRQQENGQMAIAQR